MEQENTQNAGSSSENCKKEYHEGKWTPEEHAKFVQLKAQYGNDWALISEKIGSRSPSQVRSHAQKYDNKKENDKNKIGNQNIRTRQNGECAITRKMNKNKKNQEGPETTNVIIPTMMAQEKPKICEPKKKQLGSTPDKSSGKKQNKWVPFEFKPLHEISPTSETLSNEPAEQSFFMEKIYPHFLEHPQDTFSMFSLIEAPQQERRDMEEEKGNGENQKK